MACDMSLGGVVSIASRSGKTQPKHGNYHFMGLVMTCVREKESVMCMHLLLSALDNGCDQRLELVP